MASISVPFIHAVAWLDNGHGRVAWIHLPDRLDRIYDLRELLRMKTVTVPTQGESDGFERVAREGQARTGRRPYRCQALGPAGWVKVERHTCRISMLCQGSAIELGRVRSDDVAMSQELAYPFAPRWNRYLRASSLRRVAPPGWWQGSVVHRRCLQAGRQQRQGTAWLGEMHDRDGVEELVGTEAATTTPPCIDTSGSDHADEDKFCGCLRR